MFPDYVITGFTHEQGNPGLFIRATVEWQNPATRPLVVYLQNRNLSAGRMPGGMTTSTGRGWHMTIERTWTEPEARAASWLHRPENRQPLIDMLLAMVEDERINLGDA
jgi:hypothetical protein